MAFGHVHIPKVVCFLSHHRLFCLLIFYDTVMFNQRELISNKTINQTINYFLFF